MTLTNKASKLFLAHAAIFVLIALPQFAARAQKSSTDAPKQDTHGIAVANMDVSVKPGDDFYQYANGGWMKRTEIPLDRGRVGVFSRLADLSNQRALGLIEEGANTKAPAARAGRR